MRRFGIEYFSKLILNFVIAKEPIKTHLVFLYKLKTGIQWAYLPVSSLFSGVVLNYKSVWMASIHPLCAEVKRP
jgi:hypothetical protein